MIDYLSKIENAIEEYISEYTRKIKNFNNEIELDEDNKSAKRGKLYCSGKLDAAIELEAIIRDAIING